MGRNETLYGYVLSRVITSLGIGHFRERMESKQRLVFASDIADMFSGDDNVSKSIRESMLKGVIRARTIGGMVVLGICYDSEEEDEYVKRKRIESLSSEVGHVIYFEAVKPDCDKESKAFCQKTFGQMIENMTDEMWEFMYEWAAHTFYPTNCEVSELYDSLGRLACCTFERASAFETIGRLWVNKKPEETIEDVLQRFEEIDGMNMENAEGACYWAREDARVTGSPTHMVADYYLGQLRSKYPDRDILRAAGQALFDPSIDKQDISKFVEKIEAKLDDGVRK